MSKQTNLAESFTKSNLKREDLYGLALDESQTGILILHLENYDLQQIRIVYANPKGVEMSGASPQDAIGKTMRELYPNLYTDYTHFIDTYMSAFSGGRINLGEMEYSSSEVKSAVYQVDVIPLGDKYIMVTYGNITEKKESEKSLNTLSGELEASEEKYRHLFWEHPLPALIFNTKTFRIDEVNRAAINQYGYSREEFMMKTPMDFLPRKESRIADNFESTLKSGIGGELYARHVLKDGSHINVWIKLFPLRERQANMVLATLVNVTEQLEQHEKIAALVQEAEERIRINVAREVHDSLNQNLAMSSMLIESILDVSYSYPDKVRERIERARQHLTEAVQIGREASRVIISRSIKNVGLAKALEQLAVEFERFFGTVRINLQIDYPKSLFPEIVESHLYRIANEAMSNALEHSKASEIKVGLKVDENGLFMTIKDDGLGFDFKSALDSKGLGLKTMISRAQSIGADISIESKPIKGTEITIYLDR